MRATMWLGRLLLVLAFVGVLLRPGVGEQPAQAQVSNLEVVVVIDRTRSMMAEDFDGEQTRISGVRADLAALANALPGSRFAAITFGKEVRTELPFTSDVTAFNTLISTLRIEGIFDGTGTLVDRPHDQLKELLARAEEQHPDRRRIVFFVTDGENTAPGAQRSFADLAAYVDGGAVLGYGTTEGGKMSDGDEDETASGYLYDKRTNADAISKLDEDNLRTIADELGVPFHQRSSPGAIDDIAGSLDAQLSDAGEKRPAKYEITWVFALLLLLLALPELRRSWQGRLNAGRRVIR